MRAVSEMLPAARSSAFSIISRSSFSTAAASVVRGERVLAGESSWSRATPKAGDSRSGVITPSLGRHRHGALHFVPQLPDVARPAERVEEVERFGR